MESFSRTLEHYTGSYLAKRRRKRMAVVLVLVATAALLGGIGLRLRKSGFFERISATRPVSKQKIIDDWKSKKWDDVRSECLASLESEAPGSFYLSFRGLASFYKGMDLPEGEDRAALIDEAIASLVKAILVTASALPKAQVEYVLGKGVLR